jgi:hypothetical protein
MYADSAPFSFWAKISPRICSPFGKRIGPQRLFVRFARLNQLRFIARDSSLCARVRPAILFLFVNHLGGL